MRFAVKVVPLGALGCAVALLVACGDSNGLLSGSQAGSLQDALSSAQSACDGGDAARAQVAARSFADRVNALPAGAVDRRLIANLRQGAATLEALVGGGCAATTRTTTTPTVTTTTTPTTTTSTTTTSTTPTEPTTTTPPPTTTTTTPTTTPPDNGGGPPGEGEGGPGDGDNPPGNPGGAPPGQLKKGAATP
jgi:hypothetical protein